MTKDNFKNMEEEASKATNESIESDYWITEELSEERWEYDKNRVYIPFPYSNKYGNEIFFSISRKKSKKIQLEYMFCSKNEDGTFKNLVGFNRDKLINVEEIDSTGKSSINKKISYAGINSGITVPQDSEAYKKFFRKFFTDIIRSNCLDVLKNKDYTFQEENETNETEKDSRRLEVAEAIEYRKKPELDDVQKEQAQAVKSFIKEHGLIDYLNPKLDKLHIGEHRNIYRKILGAFNVMRGKGSYLFETTAHAEAGKSLEDEIVFLNIIPKEYVFKKNNMSEASFVRYSDINISYFTRLIILWGDFGSKNAYNKIQDVFDICKILITEKEYSKDLSESNNGKFINKSLDLKVESIGGAYSTTINSFTDNDPQLESRTVSSTPFDTDKSEIMDFILYSNTSLSEQSHDKKATIEELISFKSYLLSLVGFDKEIVNPYGSVFKKYVNESNTPLRELQQLIEFFDAYCVLTHHECNNIKGNLVASEEQVNTFFSKICLENVLIPYESNFIEMLLAEGKQKELIVIDDSISDNDEEKSDPLLPYFNTALEKMNFNENEEDVTYYSELEGYRQNTFINKLLQLYKLGGSSVEHEEHIFFRLTDVKRIYYRYKAYKNIDDVGKLLHTLHLKGYLGKLDFIDPNTKQNIYYATSACKNITDPIELTDEDREEANEFLRNIGLGDANEVGFYIDGISK